MSQKFNQNTHLDASLTSLKSTPIMNKIILTCYTKEIILGFNNNIKIFMIIKLYKNEMILVYKTIDIGLYNGCLIWK